LSHERIKFIDIIAYGLLVAHPMDSS
jgi:hypothetical protein